MGLPTPGWNVVFGEIPAASKWTQLGQNDDALAAGTGFNSLAIPTGALADALITTRKLKPSLINFISQQTTNFTTTSTVLTDVTGCSFSYTAGPTAETLIIVLSATLGVSAGSGTGTATACLNLNGTDLNAGTAPIGNGTNIYLESTTAGSVVWRTSARAYAINVAANSVNTIKLRIMASGTTGTAVVSNNANSPSIVGFAISQ